MSKYLEMLRRKRTAALEAMRSLSDDAAEADRALDDAEEEQIRSLEAEIEELDGKIKVHQRIADRTEAARKADAEASEAMRAADGQTAARRADDGVEVGATAVRVTDPDFYPPRMPDSSGHHAGRTGGEALLLDVYRAQLHNDIGVRAAASDVLDKHRRQRMDQDEAVRISLASNLGADGGLVPPAYITSKIAEMPREGKPFVDVIPKEPMPATGLKAFLPQEATDTGDGVKAHAENTDVAVSEGTVTDEEIDIVQVAGTWKVTRKALDRGVGVSDLVWKMMTERYDAYYDSILLNGTQANDEVVGILNDAATTAVTWTDTTPTFTEFWPMWKKVVGDLWEARKLPPTLAIWSPKLWTWVGSQLDTTNRPLVLGDVDIVRNPVAVGDSVGMFGVMGQSQGLNIMVDANMPTDLGAGTDETAVIVTRPNDLILMETPMMSITAEQSSLDKLNVDFVLYGYIAFSSGWQSKSSAKLTGTGMKLT